MAKCIRRRSTTMDNGAPVGRVSATTVSRTYSPAGRAIPPEGTAPPGLTDQCPDLLALIAVWTFGPAAAQPPRALNLHHLPNPEPAFAGSCLLGQDHLAYVELVGDHRLERAQLRHFVGHHRQRRQPHAMRNDSGITKCLPIPCPRT